MKTAILQLTGILSLLFTFHAAATVHYVDLNSTNATPPFTDWTTAATNIQDAIDAAVDGDLVLVTNGIYATGARIDSTGSTNRVVVTNLITLQSVNGSAVTVIDGGNSMRCVNLGIPASINPRGPSALLSGFTITNGYNRSSYGGGGVANGFVSNCLIVGNTENTNYPGGGASNCVLTNCIVSYNSAGISAGVYDCYAYNCVLSYNSSIGTGGGAGYSYLHNCSIVGNTAQQGNSVGFAGGGASTSTLDNCLIVSNTCLGYQGSPAGGGAVNSWLTNCTVVGNSAYSGGGVAFSAAINCIIYYNSSFDGQQDYNGLGAFSCTAPFVTSAGSFTNAPIFVNLAAGDFHLAANSPCINSGTNSAVIGTTDLDGNPRVVGGAVDMGAYEFQTPGFTLPFLWAQQYGLSADGSADSDGDGLNNWQEWIAGTNPTNAASVLKMFSPSNAVSGLNISWQSVNKRKYYLQRTTDLTLQPAFSSIKSNLVGQAGTTVFSDTTATNGGPYFYRVGVQ